MRLKIIKKGKKGTNKRGVEMARRSGIDKNLVIQMYKDGLTYSEISEKLDIKIDTVKKCVYRNSKDSTKERKSTAIENVITLYKNGLSFRAIAEKLNSKEDRIKKIIYKYAPEEVTKRRNKRKKELEIRRLKHLTKDDLKEMRERSRHYLKKNEDLYTLAFIRWNRQSYITTKSGSLKFDRLRGVPTYGVPISYRYKI